MQQLYRKDFGFRARHPGFYAEVKSGLIQAADVFERSIAFENGDGFIAKLWTKTNKRLRSKVRDQDADKAGHVIGLQPRWWRRTNLRR